MTVTTLRNELSTLLSRVQGAAEITVEEKKATRTHLQNLWDRVGDDEEAHQMIDAIWYHVETLVEVNTTLVEQVTVGAKISSEALQESKAARDALYEVTDAIDAEDMEHPRLRDFVETVRESAREELEEWMEEEGWPDALAQAYEELRVMIVRKVQEMTGCDWRAADDMLKPLMGRRKTYNELQAEMFNEFVHTFTDTVEV